MAKTAPGKRPFSASQQRDRFLRPGNGFIIHPLLFITGRQELLGRREVLLQLQGLLELFDRLVIVAGIVKSQTQFKANNWGKWIELLGQFSLCNRFIMVAHYLKPSAIPLM